MRIIFWGFLLALLIGSTPTQARSNKVARVVSPISLGEMHQRAEESEQDFLVRIAKFMRDHTRRTGNEACGDLCSGPNGQAILLFTQQSQVTCPAMRGCPLTAPNLENKFIHTHPQINYIQLNAADVEHYNASWRLKKVRLGQSIPLAPQRFSGDDYEVGPGYMIYRNDVYYQEGRGTARRVFTLD